MMPIAEMEIRRQLLEIEIAKLVRKFERKTNRIIEDITVTNDPLKTILVHTIINEEGLLP